MAKILFFAGKGGVGKTTNASIFAYRLAEKGFSVLLNSLDPAHNLHDVFGRKIGSRPKEIMQNLQVQETDLDRWVKKYLKKTEADLKKVYKYQEAFNLHRYFKTLKYSPGLEEYAVLLALEDTIDKNADKDFIIFDTPPTALTLKFLALPAVSILWLKELKKFREMILDKKEIVTKIHTGKRGGIKQKDGILRKLDEMILRYETLSAGLKGHESSIFIVLNPAVLSFEESRDIYHELTGLGYNVPCFILNKFRDEVSFQKQVGAEFKKVKIFIQPDRDEEYTGIEYLKNGEIPLDIADLI